MNKWLYCSDFFPTGSYCCDSCVEDSNEGYGSIEYEPELIRRQHYTRPINLVWRSCCTHKKEPTRLEWANAVRKHRKVFKKLKFSKL